MVGVPIIPGASLFIELSFLYYSLKPIFIPLWPNHRTFCRLRPAFSFLPRVNRIEMSFSGLLFGSGSSGASRGRTYLHKTNIILTFARALRFMFAGQNFNGGLLKDLGFG